MQVQRARALVAVASRCDARDARDAMRATRARSVRAACVSSVYGAPCSCARRRAERRHAGKTVAFRVRTVFRVHTVFRAQPFEGTIFTNRESLVSFWKNLQTKSTGPLGKGLPHVPSTGTSLARQLLQQQQQRRAMDAAGRRAEPHARARHACSALRSLCSAFIHSAHGARGNP